MRQFLVILVVALLAAGSANAFFDDFESYADQAAFNAAWGGSSPMTLVTDKSYSGSQSIYQGTVAQQSYKYVAPIPTSQLYFSCWFYDPAGTTSLARTYAMVYSRAGTDWTGSLNQILAIGKYNTIQTTKYNGRVAFGPDAGWFVLSDGPDRSVGWHFAEIVGKPDGTVDFKIDGIVGATKNVAEVGFNWAVIGSGLSSTHGMWYDDVRLVPEPGSLLALGAGVIGLAGYIRRRR